MNAEIGNENAQFHSCFEVNYLYFFVFVFSAKNRLGDGYSMYRVSGQVIYGIYYDNILLGIGGVNKV